MRPEKEKPIGLPTSSNPECKLCINFDRWVDLPEPAVFSRPAPAPFPFIWKRESLESKSSKRNDQNIEEGDVDRNGDDKPSEGKPKRWTRMCNKRNS
ncbi:Hypothetical protein NTJ_10760 [Nesidiocoris tenuis]|uniref:Spondin domain-containing protein n=1 Tax=Nesidiocoris tenuis TaxID=355587 RepID=A0ABN7B0K8_9HEMI|nr:Hypothetical protein NTJ_10760 [Nesidiocoris tenuis]